jgi:hypothetical protein
MFRDTTDDADATLTYRRALTVLVAVLVVAPTVGPYLAVSASATAGPPSGMVGVPDSNVNDKIPEHARNKIPGGSAWEGSVMTTEGAATMGVDVTTVAAVKGRANACRKGGGILNKNPPFCEDPRLALNFSDFEDHDGRRVAVNASALVDALGYRPDLAHVEHSSGATYTVPIFYSGGLATWEIRAFSSNNVTFSGSVEVVGDPATDGTTYQYSMADSDAASSPRLTLEGVDSTDWDNVSGAGLGDGATLATNVAGLEAPRGPNASEPEVRLTGALVEKPRTESGTGVGGGSSFGVSISGDADPTGPANGAPELTLTASDVNRSDHNDAGGGNRLVGHDGSGNPIKSDVEVSTPPDTITHLKIDANYIPGSTEADIYIEKGTADQTYGEGSLVKSGWTTPTSEGTHVIDISDFDTGGSTVTISFVPATSGSDDGVTVPEDGSGDGVWWESWGDSQHGAARMWALSKPGDVSASGDAGATTTFGTMTDGETVSEPFDASLSTSSVTIEAAGGSFEWTLDYNERYATEGAGVDLNGDGTDEISHSGELAQGETVAYQASELGLDDDTLTVSTANGTVVDVEVKLKEVATTSDVSFELNGHYTNLSGPLATGSTWNTTLNESHVQEGTNRINISVGDGSLSADAPTRSVGVRYEHDARDDQTVEYEGETWSERYNVSRTWGGEGTNATLTIPFEGDVVSNRDLKVFINGSETAPTFSRFQNTTLEVGLGDVAPGTETRVVANGSKVVVHNGSIKVTEPTTEGNALNTTFDIVSRSENFRIDVSGTASSDRVHYPASVSWQNNSASALITDGGESQYLRLPNAPAGGTTRVRTAPLEVEPQSDVRITVTDPDRPEFAVEPGSITGDSVDYRYLDAKSGTEYELVSKTRDGYVLDSAEANSPVLLSADTDDTETLYIRVSESLSGSSGGGGAGGGGGGTAPPLDASGPLANPIAVLAVAVVAVLGAGVAVSRTGVARWAALATVGVVLALSIVALIPDTVGMVLTRFGFAGAQGLAEVSTVIWLTAAGIGAYTLIKIVQRVVGGREVNLNVRRGGK